MTKVFLALGSNLGSRKSYLKHAINKIQALPSTVIIRESSVYETEPVGFSAQSDFLNQVIEIKTAIPPLDLLQHCLEIEEKLGRIRNEKEKNGPRTIDIDILIYGKVSLKTTILTLPHPRMHERAFVMVPLLEIAPELASRFPQTNWAAASITKF